MSDSSYSWRSTRPGSTFRLPKSGHGWLWVAIAISFAVLLHLLFLLFAERLTLSLGLSSDDDLVTDYVNLQRVEVEAEPTYEELIPEDYSIDPPDSAQSLLEELDTLEELPDDAEFDIRVDIEEPDLSIKMEIPALSGDDLAIDFEPISAPEVKADLTELGTVNDFLTESQNGRVVLDPGLSYSDEFDPDEVTRDLARKGLDALSKEGVPEGYRSLDSLLSLKGNSLADEKGMIGSDLLFDFNKDVLRESARFSLMKVALLIDRNPDMYCWIEGHTDTIGNEEANFDLSTRRANSVKEWLVAALNISPKKIIVLGRGEGDPLVTTGDQDEQAINRRVEIKMRTTLPEARAVLVKPAVKIPPVPVVRVEEPEEVVVAEPVDDPALEEIYVPEIVSEGPVLTTDSLEATEVDPFQESPPIKAVPVEEEDLAPVAVPVEEEDAGADDLDPIRAEPVGPLDAPYPAPLRAEPVEEE